MFKKYAIGMCVLVALFFATGIVMAAENETVVTEATTPEVVVPETPLVPMDVVEVGNKICPVSGMVITEPGKFTVEYEGKRFNLCSESCKETFLKDPEIYVAKVITEISQEKNAPAVAIEEYSGEKMDVAEEAIETEGEGK